MEVVTKEAVQHSKEAGVQGCSWWNTCVWSTVGAPDAREEEITGTKHFICWANDDPDQTEVWQGTSHDMGRLPTK